MVSSQGPAEPNRIEKERTGNRNEARQVGEKRGRTVVDTPLVSVVNGEVKLVRASMHVRVRLLVDDSDYDMMVSGLELESDGDDVFDWKEIGKEGQLSVEEQVKV